MDKYEIEAVLFYLEKEVQDRKNRGEELLTLTELEKIMDDCYWKASKSRHDQQVQSMLYTVKEQAKRLNRGRLKLIKGDNSNGNTVVNDDNGDDLPPVA